MSINSTSVPLITITTAVSGTVVSIGLVPAGTKHVLIHSNFDYGSGGTSAKFYLQSSADGGTTWFDVASLAHTTADLRRVVSLDCTAAGTLATAQDAALTDNTKLDGLLGDRLRLKYTTTGTYAGSTTYKFDLVYR